MPHTDSKRSFAMMILLILGMGAVRLQVGVPSMPFELIQNGGLLTKRKSGLEFGRLPGGVIGNTRDFGSLIQGSSPCRVT